MGFSLKRNGAPGWGPQRRRMIATHSRFLTWALEQDRELPRIPTRRVDQGGFTQLMSRPAARVMASHWWHRTLDRVMPD